MTYRYWFLDPRLRVATILWAVMAAALCIKASRATNLVDRLERSGLVARRYSETDRRVTLVALTRAGHEAVEDMQPIRSSKVAAYLLALEPEAQEQLAELLERLVEGSSEQDPAADTEVAP